MKWVRSKQVSHGAGREGGGMLGSTAADCMVQRGKLPCFLLCGTVRALALLHADIRMFLVTRQIVTQ